MEKLTDKAVFRILTPTIDQSVAGTNPRSNDIAELEVSQP